MKLFYFLDFTHLKMYGRPVTFDTYINMEHGPIPTGIKNLVDTSTDDIDHSVLSDTIACEWPEGIKMCRITPLRQFTEKDSKLFSASELEVLQKVCQRFGDKNTQYIEEASHAEAPWKETRFLQEIPYTLAAKDSDSRVSEEEIKLLMEIQQ